jgi:hypothetical protein
MKRRKQKQFARSIIKHCLYKYDVKDIKEIYDDFYYETAVYYLAVLGKSLK